MRRWWKNRSLWAKSVTVLALPLVPLTFAAALSVQSGLTAHRATESVAQTLQAKAQIATVSSLITDAEAGVRGYLLTHSDESFAVYTDTTRSLSPAFRRLAALVRDDPDQVAHLRRVVALARSRPLAGLLQHAKTTEVGAPPPLALLAESRKMMAALRDEFAAMQELEDRLLVANTTAQSAAQQRQLLAGGVAGLLAILAGAFAVAMLRRWTTRVERARDEIDRFFCISLDLLCIAGTDGRFSRVNPAWTAVLGWTEPELTGVPFIEFVHPDDRDATAAATVRLADGGAIVDFENRYQCKDGTFRWLNWRAAPSPSGEIYAAARDVTEQKRTAHELEHRAEALTAANEELEAFSYSVSHDLRAPLRHVAGFAALLERKLGDGIDDDAKRFLATITGAATRMGRLIDDLLAFSRMGRTPLQRRCVKLDELVRDVRREVAVETNGREITWAVHPLPDVAADPSMLRLALVNLFSNAVKYSASCEHARIEIGSNGGRDGEAVIFVRDNGVGFDMKYAHKLFGVFQRLHSSNEFEGTGIGLANVRRIIQRHGGRTWAEGAVDRGATFYFSLPAAEESA
jgi:PAS domain S-box-containing protein